MAMKILYIGGTGEVSYGCIQAGLKMGQEISVYNRGTSGVPLPKGAAHIQGDVTDESKYQSVGGQKWDAVCQFRSFCLDQCERDIRAFAGNVGQFVFISTAMVYQRPPAKLPITESSARGNPYSPEYAQKKIAIEDRLMELHRSGAMPVTVVRPSHTVRTRLPGTFISDDDIAWRMLHGKPVIVHGDGSSLWVLTRTEDFGRAFAKLLGNPKAMGEAFHITTDEVHPWDTIFRQMAAALGAPEPKLVHVASDTLVRYEPKWAGSLLADKSWSCVFDNTKVRQAVGGRWKCRHDLKETLAMSAKHALERQKNFSPDAQVQGLVDRIVEEQSRLGVAAVSEPRL
ncbi:MAG: NAD-dependent epimerase/dehydratase family protein [Tepidisphaeraceae bacterium]|jgi:nucleoside-diphosphate-sugar epimerase